MLNGADVSKYQGNISFKDLNLDFIILKATEGGKASDGSVYVDPMLSKYIAGAAEAKIPTHFYHYARPDLGNTAEDEARHFLTTLRNMNALKPGTIMFLDYEANWNGDVAGWCKRFLDFIYKEIGHKPVIYLNYSLIRKYNWKAVIAAGYGLWFAYYEEPMPEVPWSVVAFRQTTSSGALKGISGRVDLDVFYGDAEAMRKYGYKVPGTAEPETTASKDPAYAEDGESYLSKYKYWKDKARKLEDANKEQLKEFKEKEDAYLDMGSKQQTRIKDLGDQVARLTAGDFTLKERVQILAYPLINFIYTNKEKIAEKTAALIDLWKTKLLK